MTLVLCHQESEQPLISLHGFVLIFQTILASRTQYHWSGWLLSRESLVTRTKDAPLTWLTS
jgi:hypothetical protein